MCVLKQMFFHSGKNVLRDTNSSFKTHYILVADLPGWSWSWNTTLWMSFGSKYRCPNLLFLLGSRNGRILHNYSAHFELRCILSGAFKNQSYDTEIILDSVEGFGLFCSVCVSSYFHCLLSFTCINTSFFLRIAHSPLTSLAPSTAKWNMCNSSSLLKNNFFFFFCGETQKRVTSAKINT